MDQIYQYALAGLRIGATWLNIGFTRLIALNRHRKWHGYLFIGLVILLLLLSISTSYIKTYAVSSENITNSKISNSYGDNWAFIIAGIGTFALAVMTFFIEIILTFWNRPCFAIEFENREPFCRVTRVNDTRLHAYYVRLRVFNSGRSVAKNCLGKITEVTDVKGTGLVDYDPVQLSWVGTKLDTIPLSTIDLNAKDYEYLNLVYVRSDNAGVAYIAKDELPRGTTVCFFPDSYIIQVTIYGQNVKPISKKYLLTIGAKRFHDIRLDPR